MFSGQQLNTLFLELGVTHVVTVPDSTIGSWGDAMESSGDLRVVRVCREGEAWAVAGGLHLGGATPVVLIQCTGLFESGDALRNIVHDWHLPILAVIGYRSYLDQSSLPGDTCLEFTEPVLDAWRLPYRLVTSPAQLGGLAEFLGYAQREGRAAVVLVAEGRA